MKVAVTGATGHIGPNLIRELLLSGYSVRALALTNSDLTCLNGLPVEIIYGDVCDRNSLLHVFDGVDVVFHLAAKISIDGDRQGLVYQTNVEGVKNAAWAALKSRIRRFIHFSSIHAFDPYPLDAEINESRQKAYHSVCTAYERTKGLGELEIHRAIQQGLDAVILNPSGIIGSEDYAPSRMGRALRKFFQGKVPLVPAGGFNWVDVRDVVKSSLVALEKGKTGENYILSGHWITAFEMGVIAAHIGGVSPPRAMIPTYIAPIFGSCAALVSRLSGGEPLFTSESLSTLHTYRYINNEKARTELGFNPRPLIETLTDTYQWFLAPSHALLHHG
ncbi:MAG: SDR family oxidoreductase [Verrucomicrobia bacterium]|nr:SDR family oxidoreductase [Verrucomicrobiota bacterium]